jgi:hypothetical protein
MFSLESMSYACWRRRLECEISSQKGGQASESGPRTSVVSAMQEKKQTARSLGDRLIPRQEAFVGGVLSNAEGVNVAEVHEPGGILFCYEQSVACSERIK